MRPLPLPAGWNVPAGVDIPRLMRESKGAYVAANGLPLADWVMTRLDLLGALGGLVAPVANWALGNRQMRWLLEKTLGIAQGRKLPRVASRSFLRARGPPAADPPLAPQRSEGALLRRRLCQLLRPATGRGPGRRAGTQRRGGLRPAGAEAGGHAVDRLRRAGHARRLAAHNVAMLAEAVRQGYHVVATEPAAALCLTHEYPQLLDDDDARLVAANSSEACSYLWNMHTTGKLQLDLQAAQRRRWATTCPAICGPWASASPGENLLGLIPGLRSQHVEAGCSGMAGTFGLLHKNYRTSLRAGWKLISRLRDPDLQAGATECSTCKMQMEQGTTKPTIHPIKLLALAYGLMPEIATAARQSRRARS